LRKLVARDFEDLLQWTIPAFEGILPAPADHIVQRMLFCLATHHAMAKLRLHSDSMLTIFDRVTCRLGEAMLTFASKVCPEYNTCELDKELATRQRRKAKKAAKHKTTTTTSKRVSTPEPNSAEESTHVEKRYNLNTYKFHQAGDYVREIHETGTLDGTSTQTVRAFQLRHMIRY
ncbi:uncharacterized protein TRAVEDRAFT_118034, partial [Trametes versicolor FP-101664 SS1]|uniref:uncharacterized protein n=1 Tax=Trametes versicolor (strain FP-101664) TaxID=717944 RepID=UPI0004622C57